MNTDNILQMQFIETLLVGLLRAKLESDTSDGERAVYTRKYTTDTWGNPAHKNPPILLRFHYDHRDNRAEFKVEDNGSHTQLLWQAKIGSICRACTHNLESRGDWIECNELAGPSGAKRFCKRYTPKKEPQP